MSGYILALDQGTTSSRAIIYDDQAKMVSLSQQPITLSTPRPDYVEQDALQIWHTQLSCAHDAINKAGLLATDIASLAITNQRETIVLWDKATGAPVTPALVWQDRRTIKWCQALQKQSVDATDSAINKDNANRKIANQKNHSADMQSYIQSVTGLRIDPYFSASKLVWLLDNYPKLRGRAERGDILAGTIDSWLIYKLTGGEHTIDVSNASRTLLFDIHTLGWSDDLLARFDIPKAILPKVVASDAQFGKTKKGLFAKQIAIQGVLGDQQAALLGQGCVQAGMAKNTYGTGCFMLMNIGSEPRLSSHQLLTTIAWQRRPAIRIKPSDNTSAPDQHGLGKLLQSGKRLLSVDALLINKRQTTYALEGSVFMAGAIVQWLRDNLSLFTKTQDVEALASSVDSSGKVILIPAFTGLGAPYWRSDVTASISGMSRDTTKAHIARAALEAIAYQTYDVLTAMQKDSPTPLTELRVDGGAAKNNLLMQFQADLLGVPVLRPKDTEITAKGVALLAGMNSGLYDASTLQDSWQLDRAFEPNMATDQRDAHLEQWHNALQKML